MLGMILAHLCAITLGVYANKILGGSIVGILNSLFSAEMVLYFAVQLISKLNFDDKSNDGFFYSGLAMFSLIAMNVICSFYR